MKSSKMGMYTGLRFEAKLKPIVADSIKLLYREGNSDGFWINLSQIIPISDRWLMKSRKDFIPFGAISYMPSDWDETPTGIDGQTWKVCCSLKNYEEEIELFLRDVLPYLISEFCRVEYRYEEWDTSRFDIIMPENYED
jgi:hypothetical protein